MQLVNSCLNKLSRLMNLLHWTQVLPSPEINKKKIKNKLEFAWLPQSGSFICFQVELEVGKVGFCGGTKTEVPGEKPLEKG